MKLKREDISATFFLACLAGLELEGVVLEEIESPSCWRMSLEPIDPTKQNHASEEKRKSNSHNKRASAAALINAFAQQYRADRKETGHREGHRIFREWLTIVGLFIAAGVSFFQWLELRSTDHSIAEQAKASRDQLSVMQSQLGVMEADQRPWISMVAMPKITSPLHMISSSWATLDLTFTIKNSGRLPARRVAIALKIVGFPRYADLLGEQQRFCGRGDEPLPPGAKYAEFTIFPGDQYEMTESASALADDLVEMRASDNKKRALVAGIVGCINYQFTSDERVHRTGIIFNLLRKTATQETNFAIDLDTTPIRPDDLSLSFSHVGNGPAY